MASKMKLVTQGIPGSFHFEACRNFFKDEELEIISTDSFQELAKELTEDKSIDFGVMAIENSIAGSIIQNYKILRQHRFRIIGEIYLPIHHNLLVIPGVKIEELEEVKSHPMALNQCLKFLKNYPHIKLISTADTASSAKSVREKNKRKTAAIASLYSAELYGLEVLYDQIQTAKINYTRFVIIQNEDKVIPSGKFDKASIYLRTAHKKGSLLKVLQAIYDQDINLSKLQSYPVEDDLNKYYFYLDLEFKNLEQYEKAIAGIDEVTQHLEVLGVYKRDFLE